MRQMKTRLLVVLLAAALGALVIPVKAQDTFSTDPEGFIRNWLVLAPIALRGQSGADEIDFDFLNGEAAVRPKPDAQVTVGGKPMTWKAHKTSDFFIDFK